MFNTIRNKRGRLSCFCLAWVLFATSASADIPEYSSRDIGSVGKRIFRNECSYRESCLVAWNEGENCLSLGIGHFIWYPKKAKGRRFEESFTAFLNFLGETRYPVPAWIRNLPDSKPPWKNRSHFLRESESEKVRDLERFLKKTVRHQILFMLKRFNGSLEKILAAAPDAERLSLRHKFLSVAVSENGVYALMDYINFKGEGVSGDERYRKQGWGLLQVLCEMRDAPEGLSVMEEFVRAAKTVLRRRVENAPRRRNESRWLAGWEKRIETYLEEIPATPEHKTEVVEEIEAFELPITDEFAFLQVLAP